MSAHDPAAGRSAPVLGRVALVGAGPGAADLLTLRAARLLAQAEVVLHDALVDPEVLTLAPQARRIAVGKRCGAHSTAQAFIGRRLVACARSHRLVVRLKGGDPMLFGRAHEEITVLREAGIPFEIVPGVSAAFGAAAQAAVSLTRRGTSRSVVFVTPRVGEGEGPSAWGRAAAAADTAVVYMAGRAAADIRDGLLAAGVPPARPVLVIERATLPGTRLLGGPLSALPSLAAELGDGPALIVVGEVCAQALATARESTAQTSRAA